MSAPATTLIEPPSAEDTHAAQSYAIRAGMACFLLSEAVFFATLVLTYIAYLRSGVGGPTPAHALHLPMVIVSTVCLLSSSGVIHRAMHQWQRGRWSSFRRWWLATLILGLAFLVGTALEWWDLVHREGLTPSVNLFGSTYYTLVGFHALHVSIGVAALTTVLLTVARRPNARGASTATEMISWYWHFVDAVWVVVFSVVYVIGR